MKKTNYLFLVLLFISTFHSAWSSQEQAAANPGQQARTPQDSTLNTIFNCAIIAVPLGAICGAGKSYLIKIEVLDQGAIMDGSILSGTILGAGLGMIYSIIVGCKN